MNDTSLNILGVVSPSMLSLAKPGSNDPSPVKTLLPGVGVGILGFFAFRHTHPLLGFIGAESLGMNTYRMIRDEGNDRRLAACNLATTGAAIAGSLASPKHPFLGFLAGMLAGVIATSFVAGSNAHRLRGELEGMVRR